MDIGVNMKISRQQLRKIILESLSESTEQKNFVILPFKGEFGKADAEDLKMNISMQISNDFLSGYDELDYENDFEDYFDKHNILDDEQETFYVLSEGGPGDFSKALPKLHIIDITLKELPGGEGMRIYLKYFLNGRKIKSSGGKLAGVAGGKQAGADGKLGTADDTHMSDQQLASYVKKLMT